MMWQLFGAFNKIIQGTRRVSSQQKWDRFHPYDWVDSNPTGRIFVWMSSNQQAACSPQSSTETATAIPSIYHHIQEVWTWSVATPPWWYQSPSWFPPCRWLSFKFAKSSWQVYWIAAHSCWRQSRRRHLWDDFWTKVKQRGGATTLSCRIITSWRLNWETWIIRWTEMNQANMIHRSLRRSLRIRWGTIRYDCQDSKAPTMDPNIQGESQDLRIHQSSHPLHRQEERSRPGRSATASAVGCG